MQINLTDDIKKRPEAAEFENILQSCVHCGFCNATCPTYQLSGDELDGPRGRIYLLKQVVEGKPVTQLTVGYLDRCLSCRACETTCPSGVKYSRLLDLGRSLLNRKIKRHPYDRMLRFAMRKIFPYPQRFAKILNVVRLFANFLPGRVPIKITGAQSLSEWPEIRHHRKVLLLKGCVQTELAPSIDRAAACVLDKIGISVQVVENSQCCGALDYHLSAHEAALQLARHNLDVCWPYIEQGVEAIIMTASGCGLQLKEYAGILRYDKQYADKARHFSNLVKDVSEVLSDEDLSDFKITPRKIAFQSPCTLQHGQKLAGRVEGILQGLGFELLPVQDSHLCCGSAGVYSLLQPTVARQLKDNKLSCLQENGPELIATANIGCLTHLQNDADCRVVHWVELLSE